MREAVELIRASKKAVILAGHGIVESGAEREMRTDITGVDHGRTMERNERGRVVTGGVETQSPQVSDGGGLRLEFGGLGKIVDCAGEQLLIGEPVSGIHVRLRRWSGCQARFERGWSVAGGRCGGGRREQTADDSAESAQHWTGVNTCLISGPKAVFHEWLHARR